MTSPAFRTFSLFLMAVSFIFPDSSRGLEEGGWVTLEGAVYLENASNDGDSFHVLHNGKEYIFRLYGADCPESDSSFPDRVAEQAREFGTTPAQAVLGGKKASEISRTMLQRPFTVTTRFSGALGRSRLPRYYAFITTWDGADLARALISEGFARSHGKIDGPNPQEAERRRALYDDEALRASRNGAGVWGAAPTRESEMRAAKPPPTTINVNICSLEELISLPGIGPSLAGKIVGRRPISGENELLSIPGIGPASLVKIRGKISY